MSVDVTHISVLVAQFPISLDIEGNLDTILSLLEHAEKDDLVILPEGALSGYAQDPTFLHSIDTVLLAASLRVLSNEVAQRQLHLVFGSCVYESGRWYNADLYYGPNRQQFVYRKVNLATSERGHFVAGSSLPVVEVDLGRGTVRLSIQLCREKGDFYEHSINHRRRIHRHRPRY